MAIRVAAMAALAGHRARFFGRRLGGGRSGAVASFEGRRASYALGRRSVCLEPAARSALPGQERGARWRPRIDRGRKTETFRDAPLFAGGFLGDGSPPFLRS